jgi:uncharacterized protein
MPVSNHSDHKPPFWLPNGHFQSIYPALFRVIESVPYQRERIVTGDNDFLDIDWAVSSNKSGEVNPLIILTHGLEGSSYSQYIRGMVKLLVGQGYDCLSWNFRSCSGEMNKALRFYHSGATDDLETVVRYAISKGYSHIQMMGFSLGGNLTLKYLGEQGRKILPEIKKGMVFSVPMDLKASSLQINRLRNRVYMRRFLSTLMPKVQAKAVFFPENINMKDHHKVRTLYDFDHLYTAAIHGFDGADDYYRKCSSMHFVQDIAVSTLIVNALNDPMVPCESLPIEKIAALSHVSLEITSQGGHCGFRPAHVQNGLYWSEQRALQFLEKPAN